MVCPGPSSLASRIAPQTLIPVEAFSIKPLLLDQREQHRQHLGISDLVLAVGPKADDVAQLVVVANVLGDRIAFRLPFAARIPAVDAPR